MLGQPFYHGIIRRTIISFGELFSDIQIEQVDSSKNKTKLIKVPCAYGPKEKWFRRINENDDLMKSVKVTTPRISFEIVDYQYDAQRKLVHNYTTSPENYKVYTPVPYNLTVNVYLLTRTQDETLNLMEQILPYFSPALSLTIDVLDDPLIRQTIPISLNQITSDDNWDKDFESRLIATTLSFVLKISLYGPIQKPKIIKRSIAGITQDNQTTIGEQYTAELNPFTTESPTEPHTIDEVWTSKS